MDLTTTYLGLKLQSPLVPSASPLSEDIDNIKRMEDSGAAAVVMHSVFEEQLTWERYELNHYLNYGTESYPEALTYFPESTKFHVGPEEYLTHISQAKEKVDIPIIGSLNGCSLGGWTEYSRQIQQAGASALELNIYHVPTDMNLTSQQLEETYIDIFTAVKNAVQIPVAVKLSPYFTNMANIAKRLDHAGADALVLFNRFYQPDINLERLEIEPHILLSTTHDLRLPLRWIAILYGRINADLAATSGIHHGQDVVKMLMAGANVTMLCSILMRHGIKYIHHIEQELLTWMEKNEYESVSQMQGSMSQQNCSDPSAFERAQYMRALQSYQLKSDRVYESSQYYG